MQPLSTLVRRATAAGEGVGDVRFVVAKDGRACIIGKNPAGGFRMLAAATEATWRLEKNGVVVVDVAGGQWVGQRDTRCGSCGGRFELRMVDAEQFLPHLEERPDGADPGEVIPAAPAYGDTY